MHVEHVEQKVALIADAWRRQDTAAIMSHFADDAVAISPGGRCTGKPAIDAVWSAFNRDYTNIVIEIKQVIVAGDWCAVEWSFSETRKSDGFTRYMEDAVVFTLRGEEITYWREYFDPLQEHAL